MNRKKRLCQKRVGWTQERDCKKKKKEFCEKSRLNFNVEKKGQGTSLVVQWLRIHLATQRTQVQSLVGN